MSWPSWPEREFRFENRAPDAAIHGAPELIIQMLDKLVSNAVDFSGQGDTISLTLERHDAALVMTVTNPGPPLPDRMRSQLFDSMVSMRPADDNKHLGLGLYVARLIAEGHGGTISAENTDGGVAVVVQLKGDSYGE